MHLDTLPWSHSLRRRPPNPEKLDAIMGWPSCTTISELLGFLNIVGYYRRFIQGFAKEASPLYKPLGGSPHRGTPIQCTKECEGCDDSYEARTYLRRSIDPPGALAPLR